MRTFTVNYPCLTGDCYIGSKSPSFFCLPVDFSPSKIPPTKVSQSFSRLWRRHSANIACDKKEESLIKYLIIKIFLGTSPSIGAFSIPGSASQLLDREPAHSDGGDPSEPGPPLTLQEECSIQHPHRGVPRPTQTTRHWIATLLTQAAIYNAPLLTQAAIYNAPLLTQASCMHHYDYS